MGFYRVCRGAHWWVVVVPCSSLRVATAELTPSRAQPGPWAGLPRAGRTCRVRHDPGSRMYQEACPPADQDRARAPSPPVPGPQLRGGTGRPAPRSRLHQSAGAPPPQRI